MTDLLEPGVDPDLALKALEVAVDMFQAADLDGLSPKAEARGHRTVGAGAPTT